MSSRSRNRPPAGGLLLAAAAGAGALALAGCQRQNTVANQAPAAQSGPGPVSVSGLYPGGGSPPPQDPRGQLYDGNPQYIALGKQYYTWYNCAGCHFSGGGGIGPPLMDDQWIYGGRMDQIYASIAQGRPNGMPHWGGKIPDAQIWEIAAYVRSLRRPTTQQNGAGNSGQPPEPTPPTPVPASEIVAGLPGPSR